MPDPKENPAVEDPKTEPAAEPAENPDDGAEGTDGEAG